MTALNNKQNTVNTFNEKTHQFCSFYLSNHLFGVNINTIREVNDHIEITPISHAPMEIKGYVNIRGQVYLVVDLAMLMGITGKSTSQLKKIILFKNNVLENCGVLVDDVGEVLEIHHDHIEERGLLNNSIDYSWDQDKRKDFNSIAGGICQLPGQLMVVIEPHGMLKSIEKKLDKNFNEAYL